MRSVRSTQCWGHYPQTTSLTRPCHEAKHTQRAVSENKRRARETAAQVGSAADLEALARRGNCQMSISASPGFEMGHFQP